MKRSKVEIVSELENRKVHFVGIAGKISASLAVEMAKAGWEVSGSDENVYEPALSLLNDNGIKWYEGYDARRVHDMQMVAVGSGPLMKDPENPEYMEAVGIGNYIRSFPQVIGDLIAKEENIVVAGSYGKSTTSSLIAWILFTTGHDPSFMVGGKPGNFETGVRVGDSKYSVIEGDEFLSMYGVDNDPKFVHYKPKYAIISSAKWDHADVYRTEKDYIMAYMKLLKELEGGEGKLYVSLSGENLDVIIDDSPVDVVTYHVEGLPVEVRSREADYVANDIQKEENGYSFTVVYPSGEEGRFFLPMIGLHNIENALAAIAVLTERGLSYDDISKSMREYGGIRRRQELFGTSPAGAPVIDDFAHSAMKAKATINAVRDFYGDKKIVAVYSPRISSLQNREEINFYPGAFDSADVVLLPKILVKRSTDTKDKVFAKDILNAIRETQPNCEYHPLRSSMEERLKELDSKDTVFLFMSAGGWDGLMEFVVG